MCLLTILPFFIMAQSRPPLNKVWGQGCRGLTGLGNGLRVFMSATQLVGYMLFSR